MQRQKELLASKNTSQANYDQALAARDSGQSTLDQARASTRLAQLNYEYTQVTAPFDGYVTARQVSVGQYVGSTATPTLLASIVQNDPIYVTFNVSEQDVIRIREKIVEKGLTAADLAKVPVEIGLQSETGWPHHGTLDYRAPTVTQSTGTLAVFRQIDADHYEMLGKVPTGALAKSGLWVPELKRYYAAVPKHVVHTPPFGPENYITEESHLMVFDFVP